MGCQGGWTRHGIISYDQDAWIFMCGSFWLKVYRSYQSKGQSAYGIIHLAITRPITIRDDGSIEPYDMEGRT